MLENTNKQIRIGGLFLNILLMILLIPTFYLIYLIKIRWGGEVFLWKNVNFILKALAISLIIELSGFIIHEIIKYIILKLLKIKPISIKIKDHMFFLYTPQEITINQAKIIWIVPYLFYIAAFIIAILFLSFVVAISFAFLLLLTSDDIILFFKLLKFDNSLKCKQANSFLGYTILDK